MKIKKADLIDALEHAFNEGWEASSARVDEGVQALQDTMRDANCDGLQQEDFKFCVSEIMKIHGWDK